MAVKRGATGAGSSSVSTAVQCAISSCRGIQCVLTGAVLPVSSTGEMAKGDVSGRSLWSVTVIVWGSKRIGMLLFCQPDEARVADPGRCAWLRPGSEDRLRLAALPQPVASGHFCQDR